LGKANAETNTKDKAIKYIDTQEWEVLNIEEMYITDRERYVDEPDFYEFFVLAINFGIGAIFYTWPMNDDNEI
jgi:hypothetical protein